MCRAFCVFVYPFLAHADKTIAWTVPALTEGSAMSLEFRLDLCGYCDTYNNGSFNPIDTFQYE